MRLRGEQAGSSEALTIPRRPRQGPVPLSIAQQGLWLLDQLVADSPLYNMAAGLQLSGPLNTTALHQSLNALVQRHEVLRTTFVAVDGHPMQVSAPILTIPLPVVDLSALPDAERQAEALRQANEEAQRPFDLTQGPLIRTLLLQLGAEESLLLLTMHHIISDGWSLGVLYRELSVLYNAYANGKPSPLLELPIQYADFALWQQEQLQREAYAEHLAYWKQRLAGAPTSLDLPTDRPHPVMPTYRGSVHLVTLPAGLSEALKTLSRQEAVTLHMTLVAAFQALLYRYTGHDDVVLGSLATGRTQAELEALIGFFVNVLVLRTDLSGNPTFRELLRRVREVTLEAQAHQEVPFEFLVRELQPIRSLGQNPLIQVTLSFNPSLPTLPAGWEPAKMVVETGTAKFDLSLDLADRPEGLVCRFEYSSDLFDAPTIARMAKHWQTLLEGIVADPEQRISKLPLLTEAELHQVLVEWNETRRDYPKDQCIHQMFEEQVERTPEAVAVVFEDEHLTYQELNVRVNQLAHHLRGLGVGPEVLVGLCVERSLDMLVGLLGILKAGGAYVPLDPTYPTERLAFILEDAQVHVLLTQHRLLESFPASHSQLVCLDADWQTISQRPATNPDQVTIGEHLAYVIYTSGSTGQPKGVLIEHRALAVHSRAIIGAYELAAEDCVLQFSTFTFDASLEQILPTLLVGAKLVVRGREIWSPADLLHKIKNLGLTVINLPPAYWYHVLQEWAQFAHALLDHRLRLLIVGGDRVLPEALQMWRKMPLRSVRLLNAYGPTETTITATLFDLTPHLDQEQLLEKVPIGRPLPNRTSYILDRAGNPVPMGVVGELYIGGDLLARGYLDRPELTAERFITDPFSQQPQARLYKTGDLARYLPDGTIEFLGRVDDQVKLRGFRIELGEIEEALSQHPEVRETVVLAREDLPGEKYLVAYVVTGTGKRVESQALRSYLKQKLPEYMIPAAFVQLENLPLMPNGKLDRRALRAPELTERVAEKAFVAPTLPLHHLLVQIWEDLLSVRPIGIKDDFFLLGGHSLLATRLVSRIEQVFSKKISLATLFAEPTVEHLANTLLQQEEEVPGSWSPLVAVQTGGSRRPFFFLHGDYVNGAFYCFPLARNLGPDQPFYALEPYRFDVLGVPPTLEVMAAAHLESLRSVQPEGPYLLGGFCYGGLIAYEMARQLYAQGETVDLLVLIDPTYGGRRRLLRPGRFLGLGRFLAGPGRGAARAVKRLGKLLRLDRDKQLCWFLRLRHLYKYLQYVCRYLRYPRYRKLKTELDGEPVDQNGTAILRLEELFDRWLTQRREHLGSDEQMEPERGDNGVDFTLPRLNDLFPDALFPAVEALRHDWGSIALWVMSEYEPSFYAGKSTFFFTKDFQQQGEDVEWHKKAEEKDKEVEVHLLVGGHDTCKTIHLHDLTEHLRMCLDKVQAAELVGGR